MIEQANLDDLKIIEIIIEDIKEEMRQEKNPQWGSTEDNYPSIERLKEDITKKRMYKYTEENQIQGIISIVEDDNEYDEVIENTHKKSWILHRLAIPKKYRKKGIATKLMRFAEEQAKKQKIVVLKSDTEVSNTKMNRLFFKEGYQYKGKFTYDDYPGEYNYYEKEI